MPMTTPMYTTTMESSSVVESDPSDESVASEAAYEPLDRETSERLYDDMGEYLEDDLDEKGIEVVRSLTRFKCTSIVLVSMGYRSRPN